MNLQFGTDGVRGNAERELNDDVVRVLAAAIGTALLDGGHDTTSSDVDGEGTGAGDGAGVVLVGRDTRVSGPRIEQAILAGLADVGVRANVVGVITTPGLAYLAQRSGCAAVMITASHNPYPDNGIKVFAPGGRKVDDATEERIEREYAQRFAAMNAPTTPAAHDAGALSETDLVSSGADAPYIDHLVSLGGAVSNTLHVAIDCGNGAASSIAPEVFTRLGCRVTVIHAAPNGTNINDHCGATDPTALQTLVHDAGADVGFAFDGDADRVIAVDETGAVVNGDALIGMHAIALDHANQLAQHAVAVTVMSNLGLREALAQRNIAIIETPVGDRAVLDAIVEHGLSLGGEQSGHIIFVDHATTGDGILTAVLTAALCGEQTLSGLASAIPRVPQELRTVRIATGFDVRDAAAIWDEVRALQTAFGTHGRVLVRASGTEPVVRVMVEHADPGVATDAVDRLVAVVRNAAGSPV